MTAEIFLNSLHPISDAGPQMSCKISIFILSAMCWSISMLGLPVPFRYFCSVEREISRNSARFIKLILFLSLKLVRQDAILVLTFKKRPPFVKYDKRRILLLTFKYGNKNRLLRIKAKAISLKIPKSATLSCGVLYCFCGILECDKQTFFLFCSIKGLIRFRYSKRV